MICRLATTLYLATVLLTGIPAVEAEQTAEPTAPSIVPAIPVAGSSPARTTLNGWSLAQVTRRSFGASHGTTWSGSYAYCTAEALRYQNPDGLLFIAKAPGWDPDVYNSKTRTYTRGVNVLFRNTKRREIDLQSDGGKYCVFSKVNGVGPTIAGLKTNHYHSICKLEGKPTVEWFTAEIQTLPSELRELAKFHGEAELWLRRSAVSLNSRSDIAQIDAQLADPSVRASHKRNLEKRRKYLVLQHAGEELDGQRTLMLDTTWCKHSAIPAATFDAPTGYRRVSHQQFAAQVTAGWIRELDSGDPQSERVLRH